MSNLLTQRIVFWIIGAMLMWGAVVVSEQIVVKSKLIFHEAQDYDYWFEYVDVVPTKEEFGEEQPEFVSELIIKKQVQFNWNDRLYCNNTADGSFGEYDSEVARGLSDVPGHVFSKPWKFGKAASYEAPPIGTVCMMIHEITVCPDELRLSDQPCRTQILEGREFNI